MKQVKTLMVSRIGVFAALYTVTSLVPISVFVGASSLLALNLLITPAIGILLTPLEAVSAALIGGLLSMWFAPYQAIFGLATVLLPVAGALCGSLIVHRRRLGVPTVSIFLIAVVTSYLVARSEFPYWILPHTLAIILAVASVFIKRSRLLVPLNAFIATMCEQSAMLFQAVYVLQLPYIVFLTAFPLMLYERLLATSGGTIIVFGVSRFAPAWAERVKDILKK